MLSKEIFGKGMAILSMMKGIPSNIDEEKDSEFQENRDLLFHVLSDLKDEDFMEAVKTIVREDDFFPSPARIIKLAKGQKYKTPGEAWGMVRKKIVEEWKRDAEGLPPEVVKAVQCMGGMSAIMERKWGENNEFEHFIKKEFVDIYEDLLDAAKNDPSVMEIGTKQKREGKNISMKDGIKKLGETP